MTEMFNLKQILFGLRKEYLKLEENLNELDKFLIYDRKLFNVYIGLENLDKKRLLSLEWDLKRKNYSIEKLIAMLKKQSGKGTLVWSDNKYTISTDSPIKIKEHCMVKLVEEHANKYEFVDIVRPEMSKLGLTASEKGMNMLLCKNSYRGNDTLTYDAAKDMLVFNYPEGSYTPVLADFVNAHFAKHIFTPEAIKLIEESDVNEKALKIYDYTNHKDTKFCFKIEETSKVISLVRTKEH